MGPRRSFNWNTPLEEPRTVDEIPCLAWIDVADLEVCSLAPIFIHIKLTVVELPEMGSTRLWVKNGRSFSESSFLFEWPIRPLKFVLGRQNMKIKRPIRN